MTFQLDLVIQCAQYVGDAALLMRERNYHWERFENRLIKKRLARSSFPTIEVEIAKQVIKESWVVVVNIVCSNCIICNPASCLA